MEDRQVISLLELCLQISQIHEMPANHQYKCVIERMTHEVYKFHLACSDFIDFDAVQALNEDFRTCYLCFVMTCKQIISRSPKILQNQGEELLDRLKKDAINFIQDIANQEPEKKRLISVAKFCESIEKFNNLNVTLDNYFHKEFEKYKSLIESALEDLSGEEVDQENLNFCQKFSEIVVNIIGSRNFEEDDGKKIVELIKEVSEKLDSLVCCVRFI